MNNGPEIVHEGWLVKSPPAKKIFRGKWRRRWFVLRHSGELPGQYFLFYYEDNSCRKLRGQIDLDECEQVDTGLQFENSKHKYQHMFDVRTPKRIYYLAADTEDAMMKWVHNICHVCGLKAYTPEEDAYNYSGTGEEEPSTPTTVITEHDMESPPVSPSSTTSAYIPISECFSGPPLTNRSGPTSPMQVYRASTQFHRLPPHLLPVKRPESITNNNVSTCSSGPSGAGATCDEFYDLPRQLRPPQALDLISGDLRSSDRRSMQGEWDAQKSPGTDAESSVFTDEEWTGPGGNLGPGGSGHSQRPVVNWETFPSSEGEQGPNVRPSDSSIDLDVSAEAGSWNVVNRSSNKFPRGEPKQVQLPSNKPPPPRPPKPSHLLLDPPGHNYLNIENVSPASHTTEGIEKHKIESASSSEPPSPLIATSTPLDGPSTIPGSAVVTDDMYDFPRSHQYGDTLDNSRPSIMSRHCYSNAAPGQVNGDGTVFRYDFQQTDGPAHSISNTSGLQDDEPTSPRSESSSVTSATQYSNLPSPHILPSGGIPTPPAVDRSVKPRRKTSDSVASNEPSPSLLSQQSVGPPSVDRKLKPKSHTLDTRSHPTDASSLKLSAPPNKRQDSSRSMRKTRTGPSPTPPQPPGSAPSTLRNGFRGRTEHYSSSDDDHRHSPDDDRFYNHRFHSKGKEIKYLDLDLEDKDHKDNSSCTTSLPSGILKGLSLHPAPKSPEKGPPTATVYKTVDFVKTEAFNRTRQEVEAEKKKKENG